MDERRYQALLDCVLEGRCVLVLGPELFRHEGKLLNQLLCEYLRVGEDNDNIDFFDPKDELFYFKGMNPAMAKSEVYLEMKRFYNGLSFTALHEKIAQMPFPLIVNTTPDLLLANAFEKNSLPHEFRFYHKKLNRDPGNVQQDQDEEDTFNASPDYPLIYNLTGHIGYEESLVLTYIDLFDFLLAAKMCHWHRADGARSSYFVATHQSLNLTHYTPPVLSPAIQTMDFIRFIILPANKHFDLEASFPFLSPLPIESILIENVRLDAFPVIVFQLRQLKFLTIRRGSSRPKHPMLVPEGGPYGSDSLEKLCVENYPLAGENRLGGFPRLRELVMTRCALTNITFLEQSDALEHLNVGHNHLDVIPAFISGFSALRSMDWSGNPLSRLHFSREKIPHLGELELKWTFKNQA